MREGFNELVENVFKGNPEAKKQLNTLFNYSASSSLFLKKDEIQLLEEKSTFLLPGAVAYYIKGWLSYLQKDYLSAIHYFDIAIADGDTDAMNNRAYMHQHGQGGPVNYAEAIRLYDEAIALGNPDAMNNRAYMHQHGQGGPVNYAEAIRLYNEAIALGHPDAMNNRAYMHQHGQGGPVNYAEAIRLYDAAIALGHPDAMVHRAYMHQKGQGGPVNYAEAIRLYDEAIALGHPDAMFNRAYMHQNGQGGPVNYAEAIRLYDEAIALGHPGAMNNRAYMHQHGKGGPVNYAEAIRLYDEAIALGHPDAMNNRAYMHQHGKGGPVNYAEAAKLYRQATLKGYKIALKNLSTLLASMPREHPDFAFVQYQALIVKNTPSFTFLKKYPHLLSYFIDDPFVSATDKIVTLAALQYHKELARFLIDHISSILEAFPSSPFILPQDFPPLLFVQPLRETLLNALIALNTPKACLTAGLLIQTCIEHLEAFENLKEEYDKPSLYYAVALYETVISMTNEDTTNENKKLYQYAQLHLGHLKIIFNLNLSTNPSPVDFVSPDIHFKTVTNDFSEKASWEPFEKTLKQTLKTHLKQWDNPLSLNEFYLKYLITQEESPSLFIEGLIQGLSKKSKSWSKKEKELYTLLDKTAQSLSSAVSQKAYTPSLWTFNSRGSSEKLAILHERLAYLKQSTGTELGPISSARCFPGA